MEKIAIIGSGLASAYAILACAEEGITPTVFIKDSVIPPIGAVFLRWIPEILEKHVKKHRIYTYSVGTCSAYIRKQWTVYPPFYKSSFPRNDFSTIGYNPKDLLEYIFKSSNMIDIRNTTGALNDDDLNRMKSTYGFNLIFHSFPTSTILEKYSTFVHRMYVLESIEHFEYKRNEIIYNGNSWDIKVRESLLFGKKFVEISPRISYSPNELQSLFPDYRLHELKDISPNCIAPSFPESDIIPIGRFARMNRDLLAEDSYLLVKELIHK